MRILSDEEIKKITNAMIATAKANAKLESIIKEDRKPGIPYLGTEDLEEIINELEVPYTELLEIESEIKKKGE